MDTFILELTFTVFNFLLGDIFFLIGGGQQGSKLVHPFLTSVLVKTWIPNNKP